MCTKINKKNNSLCIFCNRDEETVENLFWHWTLVKFWDDICTCLSLWPYNDLSIFLNCENIILGITNMAQN